jgi:hypothetical protein
MKTAIFGFVIAMLILASALAHALLGWPAMETSLAAQSIDRDLLGALAVGWYFGSASMLAFSFIVAVQALRRFKGASLDIGTLSSIAAVYVLFGTAAFILRSFNPHFLLFVVTGILVAAFAGFASANSTN